MQKVGEIYGTLRDSKTFLIIDSTQTEVSGNLSVLQNLDVCGNITFNNTDLSSALSNLVVDLTGGQDASLNNVDISGILKINNLDVSGKLSNIDASLVALASGGGGGGPDVLSLKLNQKWIIGIDSFPWQVGSRLGPEFTSNPYDIIGTAPSSLSIGEDYLITANTAGIYKFEIAANYRWYSGCKHNRTMWICIRNGYPLSGYTADGLAGYDIVHRTWAERHIDVNDTSPPQYDWSFPENFLFTVDMAAGDRIMHGHFFNRESAVIDPDYWSYTVSVTKVG